MMSSIIESSLKNRLFLYTWAITGPCRASQREYALRGGEADAAEICPVEHMGQSLPQSNRNVVVAFRRSWTLITKTEKTLVSTTQRGKCTTELMVLDSRPRELSPTVNIELCLISETSLSRIAAS